MAADAPTETLNPSLNGNDAVNPAESSELLSQSAAEVETTTEKRKREEEPEPSPTVDQKQHPLWKTSLCSYFRRSNGLCSHGDTCRYAHGESELRIRPDNTWDPTSERAKKKAKKDEDSGESVKEEENGGVSIMMTEAFAEGEDGGYSAAEAGLTKCLVNLPMRWTSDNLRSFLNEHKVPSKGSPPLSGVVEPQHCDFTIGFNVQILQSIIFKSAKKKKGMIVGFVSFESAAQVKRASEELEGKSVGNKTLKVADVIPRPFEKKDNVASAQTAKQAGKPVIKNSSIDESSKNSEDGEPTDDNSIPKSADINSRSARAVVTPLAHMPYSDQLEHKKKSLMQNLKRLTRNARKACPSGVALPEWIHKSREIGGLPCKLEGILESPLVNGYRNKCEFSVGYSLQGKPTVGFLLGNFREGVTAVEEPKDCPNVSKISCRYAAIFQEFLQNSSLPIWNRLNNTGFWRQLTAREGRMPGKSAEVEDSEPTISEVMLMVQVCTVGLDDELVDNELQRLARAFTAGASAESPSMPLTALVIQDHKGISNAAPADAPLRSLPISKNGSSLELGSTSNIEGRIHDYISNLQFSISPTAFFQGIPQVLDILQVNTLAAEKLYALAGDWAGLGPDTLLFDICCGTGTIGLTLADRVGMVVGIEMNASAVADAQRNAEINGVKNCRFICAKAEDVIGSLLQECLILPSQQEEISETEKDKKDIKISEGKLDSSEDVTEPEESSVQQLNGQQEFCSLENGNTDVESQSCSNSKSNTTSLQQFKNIVAIVDPPRVGLHPTVTKVLRTHHTLRRLVYISCNPDSLVANAIELCTPLADKTDKGRQKNNWGWKNMSSAGLARHRVKSMPNSEPFKPIKAMAVDLFPHTPHCELVMLLER